MVMLTEAMMMFTYSIWPKEREKKFFVNESCQILSYDMLETKTMDKGRGAHDEYYRSIIYIQRKDQQSEHYLSRQEDYVE